MDNIKEQVEPKNKNIELMVESPGGQTIYIDMIGSYKDGYVVTGWCPARDLNLGSYCIRPMQTVVAKSGRMDYILDAFCALADEK